MMDGTLSSEQIGGRSLGIGPTHPWRELRERRRGSIRTGGVQRAFI